MPIRTSPQKCLQNVLGGLLFVFSFNNVSADYVICHNDDLGLRERKDSKPIDKDLCGTHDYSCSRIMASALGNAYFSSLSETVITFKGIPL